MTREEKRQYDRQWRAAGLMKDRPELLRAAAEYLEKYA